MANLSSNQPPYKCYKNIIFVIKVTKLTFFLSREPHVTNLSVDLDKSWKFSGTFVCHMEFIWQKNFNFCYLNDGDGILVTLI